MRGCDTHFMYWLSQWETIVTLYRRLSLAGHIHKMIPVIATALPLCIIPSSHVGFASMQKFAPFFPIFQAGSNFLEVVGSPFFYTCTTKLLGGILVSPPPSVRPSVHPSVRPSRILCPLCSTNSFGWIHLIFIHLIKQLQQVCRV